jgi:AcrR family transcriptional regulator
MRRIGAADSETRASILDTTEQLMVNEGYAAVTTRRVAKEISLAPGLVHYYFPTTDDLLVAVYRRAAGQTIERLKVAVLSDQPMRALWTISIDAACTALTMEFMAMANHRKAIRSEIVSSGEKARKLQADALSKLGIGNGEHQSSSLGITVLLTGISRLLVMEEALGLSSGHKEASAMVENWVRQLDKCLVAPPGTAPAKERQVGQRNARISLRGKRR